MGDIAITEELLLGLGVPPAKAAQVVASASGGKGKKFVARLGAVLAAVPDGCDAKDRVTLLYTAAEKLTDGVPPAALGLLTKYLFAPAAADAVTSKSKFDAAVAFFNAGVDEKAFKAAAGVGVVVAESTVAAEVSKIVQEQTAAIVSNGYRYKGRLLGSARKVDALKFAAPDLVAKHVDAALTALLGEQTDENTKGKSGKKDKKDTAVAKKQAKGDANAAAAPAAEETSEEQRQKEEDRRRDLLTAVALKHDLDAGALIRDFMCGGGGGGGGGGDGGAPTKQQVINPIDVDGGDEAIDYTKLIREFGTERITDELIARFERVTGSPAHHFLRRGIFFSHRDLGEVLDAYEAGKPFYLYTGRGPSSASMHLGHLIPFVFTKYLQEAFDCNLVIQMTDDEKYLWKDLSLEQLELTLRENVRDIIAIGFNPAKTFIFSDFNYMGGQMYRNVVQLQKRMTGNQAMKSLALSTLDNIGKFAFSAIQAAPSFSSSFPHMFGADSNNHCLIPCAIDQDVYFRLTRGIAPKLGLHKPAVIHSSFFPAIGGQNTKMHASSGDTIFLTDTAKEVHDKIHKLAFSGSRGATLEEHRRLGADLDKDVSYQYLRFFQPDDAVLDDIGTRYSKGEMTTGEIKNELVTVLQEVVRTHQTNRANVTDDDIALFMSADPARFQRKP